MNMEFSSNEQEGFLTIRFHLASYEMSIILRETDHEERTYFVDEATARGECERLWREHVSTVSARSDANEIVVEENYEGDGCHRIVWWKKLENAQFACMKDYFIVRKHEYNFEQRLDARPVSR